MDIERLTNEEVRKEIEKRKERVKKIATFIAEFTKANGKIRGDICEWIFFGLRLQSRTIEGIALDASYNGELFFSVWFDKCIGDFNAPFIVDIYDTNNFGLAEIEKSIATPEEIATQKLAGEATTKKTQDAASITKERRALLDEAKNLKLL